MGPQAHRAESSNMAKQVWTTALGTCLGILMTGVVVGLGALVLAFVGGITGAAR
jgi:hypothetical protein